MEENMSDEENRENASDTNENPIENAKRLKTDNEKSEESSSSSNNTEQESASTSIDSGFPRSRNSKYRNYRTRTQEPANEDEDSAETDPDAEVTLEGENIDFVQLSSPASSDSTVIISESDIDSESEECAVLKKEMPKHNWFVVNELTGRQIGSSSKLQSSELFQRRCYGSLRNVQHLELMYKLEEHDGCVNCLNFHPNGTLLASGSDDLKVCIWDWKIGKCLIKYETKHRGNVFQSKFLNLSGDLHIATCARDGQVRLARVAREEGVRENRKMGSHRGPCHKLALLNEQPQVLLSAGEDGLVLSHDVRRQKPTKIVNVKEDEREVALYSIHGHPLRTHEFCVSGRDHIVRTYDQRKTDETLGRYYPFEGAQSNEYGSLHVTCAVYNHDGSEILASYNDADIYLFDVNNSKRGSFIHRYQGHRNGATIKGVNFFGPKSEFIVSGSDCGNVFFWERNTEAIVQWMLADDNGVVNCLEPHPQLPYICTSGLDYDVKVWVPSNETEPEMKDLAQTVMDNCKSRVSWSGAGSNEVNESQMLWMLWRHLRTTNRVRRVLHDGSNSGNFISRLVVGSSSSGSSSNSTSNDEDDDDDIDGNPSGCSTS